METPPRILAGFFYTSQFTAKRIAPFILSYGKKDKTKSLDCIDMKLLLFVKVLLAYMGELLVTRSLFLV